MCSLQTCAGFKGTDDELLALYREALDRPCLPEARPTFCPRIHGVGRHKCVISSVSSWTAIKFRIKTAASASLGPHLRVRRGATALNYYL
jgi:hypothetical protein